MDRRNFIKTGTLAGIGGLALMKGMSLSAENRHFGFTAYVPEAPAYPLDALEPFVDQMTMDIHSRLHHKAYSNNLNAALEKADSKFAQLKLETLFETIDSLPADLQTAVRNHGGGHWNHNFFWKCMSPQAEQGQASELLSDILVKDFGSLENFKTQFKTAALGVFGSGWAWLVVKKGKAEILKTANQVNPLMGQQDKTVQVLLGVDVWEHAYYLKYQNRRAEYLDQFWNVVNWNFISAQLK